MFKNIIVIAGMLVSSIELAYADRDGFLLSAGLGLNSNYLAFNNDNGNYDLESSWGAASQLKIGGVINHQHAVYYHAKSSLFAFEDSDSGDEYLAGTGFSGLGYTYFANPTVGSPYIETTVGIAAFTATGFTSINNREYPLALGGRGNSFLIGVGYEFSNFFQAGVTYDTYFNFSDDDSNWDFNYRSVAANFEFKLQL